VTLYGRAMALKRAESCAWINRQPDPVIRRRVSSGYLSVSSLMFLREPGRRQLQVPISVGHNSYDSNSGLARVFFRATKNQRRHALARWLACSGQLRKMT
jgi:hypothetical protein